MNSSDNGFLTISKMEAAECQLITAIRLFFRRGDPFSIHTLAGAAVGILGDLASARGITNPFIDNDVIRPEMKGEFRRILRQGRNFLKHADRDPNDTWRMKPDLNKFSIFEGMFLYEALNEDEPGEFVFYRIWFSYHHPHLFTHADWPSTRELVEGLSGGRINEDVMTDYNLITQIIEGQRGTRFRIRKMQ